MNIYCHICGKENINNQDYHLKCIKKLFSTNYFPEINISLDEIALDAQEMAGKLSISGVQAKLSLKLNKKTKQLELAPEHGEYILKPQIETFKNIPQNENLCMTIAEYLGIDTPPHSLIKLKDNTWAYIVKRFDRFHGEKIHQEDFAQILGYNDKYKGSLEQIAKKIKEISYIPGLDIQLLFERILLFFILGNGDAHLKNFSIIYDKNGQKRLSPIYDIVCSKLVIPKEEDFAITINGKKNKLTGEDFKIFAQTFNINTKICYENILGRINIIKKFINTSELTSEEKEKMQEIIQERSSRIITYS